MAKSQELSVQEKKEIASKEESTVPARYYVPYTDIYETEDGLIVVMEVPGVEKKDLKVDLEEDALKVEAQIDFKKYNGLDPLHTEYNVGHFRRSFTLGSKVDRDKITAQLDDGVLTLTLKKTKEASPRSISIS
ncbi:MAG: Hsp20/alpha crystallin family protein [Alphaproteobacteria bacterium]|nr:MAG: Hsp20/alpha crystallin family protein [Alphaproteobacteria bacterium]